MMPFHFSRCCGFMHPGANMFDPPFFTPLIKLTVLAFASKFSTIIRKEFSWNSVDLKKILEIRSNFLSGKRIHYSYPKTIPTTIINHWHEPVPLLVLMSIQLP